MMELIKDYRNLENGWNGGLSEAYVCCLNLINNKKVNNILFDKKLTTKILDNNYYMLLQIVLKEIKKLLPQGNGNKYIYECIDLDQLNKECGKKMIPIVDEIRIKYYCVIIRNIISYLSSEIELFKKLEKKTEEERNKLLEEMERYIISYFNVFENLPKQNSKKSRKNDNNKKETVEDKIINEYIDQLNAFEQKPFDQYDSFENYVEETITVKNNIEEGIEKINRNLIKNSVEINEFAEKYEIKVEEVERIFTSDNFKTSLSNNPVVDCYNSYINENIIGEFINFFGQLFSFEFNDNLEANIPDLFETRSQYYHGKYREN